MYVADEYVIYNMYFRLIKCVAIVDTHQILGNNCKITATYVNLCKIIKSVKSAEYNRDVKLNI